MTPPVAPAAAAPAPAAPGALAALAAAMRRELVGGILPYWERRTLDEARGGFVGFIDADEAVDPDAPRSAILTTRLLWTFSAAFRALGDPALRTLAERAGAYLRAHFLDPVHGGAYWMVSADGAPLDERKHVYAQAFAIYALAEHHRATGDADSLRQATALFELVERHAADPVHGGYEEAFTRDWTLLDDVRLSEADANEPKSTNTHLHLLEAYATLLRAWPDARLRARLAGLVELFLTRIVDPATAHAHGFFGRDWTPRPGSVSYGHDIETAWLLVDAADAVGDAALRARVEALALAMARAVLGEAYDAAHGGIFYETRVDGALVDEKEWWPQAEAIVGFTAAWQLAGDDAFLRAAEGTWAFVERHVVDHAHGEWFRRTTREGVPLAGMEKVGPWKCPYHNARACLELLARSAGAARAGAGDRRVAA